MDDLERRLAIAEAVGFGFRVVEILVDREEVLDFGPQGREQVGELLDVRPGRIAAACSPSKDSGTDRHQRRLTRIFEFRPLCSYFSRRPGG